ncbi:hypothetical protein B0H67DRAFT_278030 [Lasiosphaeris hirsuta]|uniref:Uncharacterized protein n=1 Tax=Lasiosphaeris hirsuta TaxID=260670 RepID=A0AA40A8C2_9PEZI|nr:hypothetical protein B0H67DRAFT_278030 [Lasiosphaeris hirsuta]
MWARLDGDGSRGLAGSGRLLSVQPQSLKYQISRSTIPHIAREDRQVPPRWGALAIDSLFRARIPVRNRRSGAYVDDVGEGLGLVWKPGGCWQAELWGMGFVVEDTRLNYVEVDTAACVCKRRWASMLCNRRVVGLKWPNFGMGVCGQRNVKSMSWEGVSTEHQLRLGGGIRLMAARQLVRDIRRAVCRSARASSWEASFKKGTHVGVYAVVCTSA